MRTTRKTSVSATSRIEIIVMRNNDLNWWPLEGNLHCIYFDGNIFFHRIEGKKELNIVIITNGQAINIQRSLKFQIIFRPILV